MSFPNIYTHRKVADTSAKPCDICFKSTSSVLITPDNKDFFYVCPGHLKDTGFCTPKIDKEAEEARKKNELEAEVERVKKEYEEKQKKKKEEKEKKEKEKEEKDKKEKDKKEEKGKKEDEVSERGVGYLAKSKSPAPEEPKEEEPRVFELKSTFYQQRVMKKRQLEMAKRNRERLADPSFFPSVPKGLP
ncbi:VPS4-associated protein 1 [Podospora aff. communis PSN243]|uniref:VPS4-associated protein 1 n=1 Tax=Podospora aff. communis PSN243 TaxID=3040156 RepID=A0AAV9GE46_9PEZI|nr:VPS4-associated protein 1 [Podospora aff. communis PSN243]